MSYTQQELDTLSYVVTFFGTTDYKFIAPLIRKEFGNVRTVGAYVSRMYCINIGFNLSNQLEQYNRLTLNNVLLRRVLKPEEEEEEKEDEEQLNINLIQSEHYHHKIEMKLNFQRLKNLLQKEKDKVARLESELKTKTGELPELTRSNAEFFEPPFVPLLQMPKLERANCDVVIRDLEEEEEEKQTVVFDEGFTEYFEQMQKDMIPKTIQEWTKNPLKTKPTYPVYVKSQADNTNKYKVRYIEKTGSYHCECLAWKYQKMDPKIRTCKHINAVYPETDKYKYVLKKVKKNKKKKEKKLVI